MLHNPAERKMKLHLYCEDCVIGMPLRVEPGSVDVVVTSPPYNLNIHYSIYKDSLPSEDYLAWTLKWTRIVHGYSITYR